MHGAVPSAPPPDCRSSSAASPPRAMPARIWRRRAPALHRLAKAHLSGMISSSWPVECLCPFAALRVVERQWRNAVWMSLCCRLSGAAASMIISILPSPAEVHADSLGRIDPQFRDCLRRATCAFEMVPSPSRSMAIDSRSPNISRKIDCVRLSSRSRARLRLRRSASALSRIAAIRRCSSSGGSGISTTSERFDALKSDPPAPLPFA